MQFMLKGLRVLGLAAALLSTWTPPQVHAQSEGPRLTRPPVLVHFEAVEPPEGRLAPGELRSVLLDLVIDAEGLLESVEVIDADDAILAGLAREAALRFRFEPAEVDEVPSRIRIQYRYDFEGPPPPPPPEGLVTVLAGVVRDADTDEPLAGVEVSSSLGVQTTGADGAFFWEHVPPGVFEMALEPPDQAPSFVSERVEAGTRVDVVYLIRRAATGVEPGVLLEILVTGPRQTGVVASTRIEAAEARGVPGTGGDVVRVVESMPGVARAGAGQATLVVWGAAPEDTRVYLDGVPLPRLYHEAGVRSVVHPQFVSSIALVPGGWGAAWGRGLGGIVLVETADREEPGTEGTVAADLQDVSGAWARRWDHGMAAGAAGRVGVLRPLARLATSQEGAFVPLPQFWDGQARWRLEGTEGQSVTVAVLGSGDRVQRGVPNRDPALVTSESRGLDFGRAWVRYVQEPPGTRERMEVTPWVGWESQFQESSFGEVRTREDRRAVLGGVRALWRRDMDRNLALTTGLDLEWARHQVERQGSLALPPREGDARVFGQPPPDTLVQDRHTTTMLGVGLFAEGTWTALARRLEVTPGLRVDPHVRSASRRTPVSPFVPEVGLLRSDLRVEPRLATSLALIPERWSLRAAAGRYHQFPQPGDVTAAFGNPQLGLPTARHLLAGTDVGLGGPLRLEVTAFRSRSEGLVVRNQAQSPPLAQALTNDGEGRARGIQVLLRRSLQNRIFGWVAWTWSQAERKDGPSTPWRRFDFDQTHVATGVLGWQPHTRWDLSLRARYATGMPRTEVTGARYDALRDRFEPVFGARNGVRLPDFLQLDVRIAHTIPLRTGRLLAFLEVLNVSARDNAEEFVFSPDFQERAVISGLPLLPVVGLQWSF